VVYPLEIDVIIPLMSDIQECKLARTRTTTRIKTVLELMADGMTERNPFLSHLLPRKTRRLARSTTSVAGRGRSSKGLKEVIAEGIKFPVRQRTWTLRIAQAHTFGILR